MHTQIIIPYNEAEKYIKEADVLLCRGKGIVSQIISKITRSPYTHVGLASWSGNPKESVLEMVEFKEFRGGRTSSLAYQATQYPNRIDVYRAVPCIDTLSPFMGKSGFQVNTIIKSMNGRNITNFIRRQTGKPYSMWHIGKFAISWLPFTRWLLPYNTDDTLENDGYVCSIIVCCAFKHNYTDLVKNLPDSWCRPVDISQSALLTYLFTIGPPQ